jgi:hypothetical protein
MAYIVRWGKGGAGFENSAGLAPFYSVRPGLGKRAGAGLGARNSRAAAAKVALEARRRRGAGQ